MITPALRDRYLRDPLPLRLGGLAADLARIASFAENPKNREAVASLLEEGKHFAEWAAAEAPVEIQAALAEVQVSLAVWQRRWERGQSEPSLRNQAAQWADRLLTLSGLQ